MRDQDLIVVALVARLKFRLLVFISVACLLRNGRVNINLVNVTEATNSLANLYFHDIVS